MIVSAIFSIATSTCNYIYASILLIMMQSINNLKDTIIIKMAIGRELSKWKVIGCENKKGSCNVVKNYIAAAFYL